MVIVVGAVRRKYTLQVFNKELPPFRNTITSTSCTTFISRALFPKQKKSHPHYMTSNTS